MSRVHCTNCGRDGHAKWQCTRPTKSTAALTEAQVDRAGTAQDTLEAVGEPDQLVAGQTYKTQAGTQALPVDTNNPSSRKGIGVESLRTKGLASPAKVRDAETANTKDAAKFDKVAYQRVYMAKWRSEIKSGKRVPKRKEETT